MIETLLDFSGLEDISRDLQLLSGAENNRVLREATRAGANVLKRRSGVTGTGTQGKTAPQCGGPFPALPRWRDGIRCAYPGC